MLNAKMVVRGLATMYEKMPGRQKLSASALPRLPLSLFR